MTKTIARALGCTLGWLCVLTTIVIVTGSPASAESCSFPQPNREVCTGIRNEVISSKLERGTVQYNRSVPDLYFNGELTDKTADGECTWMRALVTGAYWPDGNPYTQPSWRVCGAGKSAIIGIPLDQAFTYPNNLIQIQHCWAAAGQHHCTTVFERRIPG